MRIILFLMYGNRPVYHLELAYSVLSVARFLRDDPAGIRIVLAADDENKRPDLPVDHLHITPEMLHAWQMEGEYNHAAKAYLLQHAVQQFAAPTILMDSDTILHDHPKKLFDLIGPGQTLMHKREGQLRDSDIWPEWRTLITHSGGLLSGHRITAESVMFNSGVLGVHPDDSDLLDNLIAVLRSIRKHSDMFTSEQLAASLVFGAPNAALTTCETLVEHYWDGPRAYYHYQMHQMINDNSASWTDFDQGNNLPSLHRSPPVAIRHRLAARVMRMRRSAGPEFGFAYQAYLGALSLRESNPDLANVWSNAALAMLKWGAGTHSVRPADFRLFSIEYLERQTWMQEELRVRWYDYWSNARDCSKSSASP